MAVRLVRTVGLLCRFVVRVSVLVFLVRCLSMVRIRVPWCSRLIGWGAVVTVILSIVSVVLGRLTLRHTRASVLVVLMSRGLVVRVVRQRLRVPVSLLCVWVRLLRLTRFSVRLGGALVSSGRIVVLVLAVPLV